MKNNQESEGLALIVREAYREYPVAPILNVEGVETKEMNHALSGLYDSGSRLEIKRTQDSDLLYFRLPERAPFKDPRGLLRRIRDKFMLKVLGDSSAASLEERMENGKKLAIARYKYNTLVDDLPVLKEAAEKLKDSYENISTYCREVRNFMTETERQIVENENRIKEIHDENSLWKNSSVRDEVSEELEECLPEESNVAESLSYLDREILFRDSFSIISKLSRENEFAKVSLEKYASVLQASEDSLDSIEGAMVKARDQTMNLQRTINNFKGITENQIEAGQSILNLEVFEAKERELLNAMDEVNEVLHTIVSNYTLTPANSRIAPDTRVTKSLAQLTK